MNKEKIEEIKKKLAEAETPKAKAKLSPLTSRIEEGAFLVDVRPYDEFIKASVEGAVNIPMHKLPFYTKVFKHKENIIFFSEDGTKADYAKHFLLKKGFEDITNGGSWKKVREAYEKAQAFKAGLKEKSAPKK